MKKISIVIPCFNEVENVELMSFAVINVLEEALPQYDYEILFIDNCSTDGTRAELEKLCAKNKKIKAIFNVTNFGQFNSPFTRCVSPRGIVRSVCAVIFRIRWNLSRDLFRNGRMDIRLSAASRPAVRRILWSISCGRYIIS